MTTQNAAAASAMENQTFPDGNTDQKNDTASITNSISKSKTELRREVLVIPVSNASRVKEFYGRLGWGLDADCERARIEPRTAQ
jgi:hypothetical protein